MKRVWLSVCLLTVLFGLYAYSSVNANTLPADNSSPQAQVGPQGNQPVPPSGAGPNGVSPRNGRPVVLGKVAQISGRTLTVTNPIDNATTTVTLASNARLTRQAEGKLADLKVGDTVTVMGSSDGNTLQASAVQIGSDTIPGLGDPALLSNPPRPAQTRGNERPVPANVPPPEALRDAPGGTSGAPALPQVLSGTVAQIKGDLVVVAKADGSQFTIRINSSARVTRQVAVRVDQIKAGQFIVAEGTRTANGLEATRLVILPNNGTTNR